MALKSRLGHRRWRAASVSALSACASAGSALAQERYIILALFQFCAGHRKSEQMSPFAAELTDEDLGNLAAFYSARRPAPPTQSMDPQKAAVAHQLADTDHCTQCHGPDLLGQEHIPRLAGQH
jgi:cytochrome c553